MERISYSSKYTKETFLLLISRMFERAGFYGFRSLLVLYMTSEAINLENIEALEIYGWFTGGTIVSYIIGALVSDLKIGNRNGLILGGTLQAIGALSICIQTLNGLYLGLSLILIGTGFYTPNIQAQFGKLYFDKPKLLDAAFTIFFLAVNLGAFAGPLLIGSIGEQISYSYGFIVSAILSVCSILIVLLTKPSKITYDCKAHFKLEIRIILIAIVFLFGGLYWGINEIAYGAFQSLYNSFSGLTELDMPRALFIALDSSFTIPLSIVAIIVWSYYYYNPYIKLTIGFVLAAISFAAILFMTESATSTNLLILIASGFMLAISDIHISPVVLSVATKYTNPKYLATTLSLASLPGWFLTFLVGAIYIIQDAEAPLSSFVAPTLLMGIFGLALIIAFVFLRKKYAFVLKD